MRCQRRGDHAARRRIHRQTGDLFLVAQEFLVNRLLRFHRTFELAQPQQCLVGAGRIPFQGIQLPFQPGYIGSGDIIGGPRAIGDTVQLFIDLAASLDNLFANFREGGMTGPQCGPGIRFSRNTSDNCERSRSITAERRHHCSVRDLARAPDLLDLVESGLGFRRLALGIDNATVEFAQLLLANQLPSTPRMRFSTL